MELEYLKQFFFQIDVENFLYHQQNILKYRIVSSSEITNQVQDEKTFLGIKKHNQSITTNRDIVYESLSIYKELTQVDKNENDIVWCTMNESKSTFAGMIAGVRLNDFISKQMCEAKSNKLFNISIKQENKDFQTLINSDNKLYENFLNDFASKYEIAIIFTNGYDIEVNPRIQLAITKRIDNFQTSFDLQFQILSLSASAPKMLLSNNFSHILKQFIYNYFSQYSVSIPLEAIKPILFDIFNFNSNPESVLNDSNLQQTIAKFNNSVDKFLQKKSTSLNYSIFTDFLIERNLTGINIFYTANWDYLVDKLTVSQPFRTLNTRFKNILQNEKKRKNYEHQSINRFNDWFYIIHPIKESRI